MFTSAGQTSNRLSPASFFQKAPLVFGALGVVILSLFVWMGSHHPDRAMFSYLFAYVSVLAIALGCMVFVLIQHVTRAGWSVNVRRVAEVGMVTMPLFLLLFIPIAVKMSVLFPWLHINPDDLILSAKAPYLNGTFFLIRSFAYLILWVWLGHFFYRKSVSQDAGGNADSTRSMWKMSAPGVLIYALTVTFASFDWLMSLQPHWYSTIFGVYFFAGCLLSGLAFMTLFIMCLQRAGMLKSVTEEHFHDLGKLLFGFTVFWAYIAFSQFMLIWYANIPEEVEFFLHRLHHGWEGISWWMPITHFFLPFFFLMSRHVKKVRWALASACVYILFMQFVNIYWLVMPNVGAHGGHPSHMHVEWLDIAGLVGLLCLFVAFVCQKIAKVDVLPSGDPRLVESVHFENF